MNHLVPIDDATWRLPPHAKVVVYDRRESTRDLLTIYGCAATQSGPKAKLLGTLESVDARAEVESNPTGSAVTLLEEAVLEETESNRFRIRRR